MSEAKYQKHRVILTAEEQEKLTQIVQTGTESARTIRRANIILASDENRDQGRLSAKKIAEIYHLHPQTVHNIRKQYCQQGLDKTITRKKGNTQPPPKITGDKEAKIIALACSQLPEGRGRWTLKLLADRAIELGYFESISNQSIRRVLKNKLKPHLRKCWCIPPKQNAEFVARMEEILDTYQQPYDSLIRWSVWMKNPISF